MQVNSSCKLIVSFKTKQRQFSELSPFHPLRNSTHMEDVDEGGEARTQSAIAEQPQDSCIIEELTQEMPLAR
jgi:hypothetical protein